MVIITSHDMLDFDALACMVAAEKLYPGAVKVYSGMIPQRIKRFLSIYKDSLMIKKVSEIDKSQVKTLVVVDTANPQRIINLDDLLNKSEVEKHIYDHHPPDHDDIQGDLSEIHLIGAATSILVEEIIKRNLGINSFEATIMALGIYEDTGNLLFPSTTARDLKACAFLLESGANLEVVAHFIDNPFTTEQQQVLKYYLQTIEHYKVNNLEVVIAWAKPEKTLSGLDVVTHHLFAMEDADVIFTLTGMGKKVQVIARSRTDNANLNDILKELGGRGHSRAAAALVRDLDINAIKEIILNTLQRNIKPLLLAGQIMSTPVKTLSADLSLEEAGKVMLRYGHTGMPVVDGNKMIGMISRRDVDKSRLHHLEHAPVKGFMSTNVVFVSPQDTVNEAQKLMVKNDIGRLPVVDHGKLCGIISRTDILRTLHGKDYPDDYNLLYNDPDEKVENYYALMQARLPDNILAILRTAGRLAESIGSTAYIVGGFVRDLLINEVNYDFDLVIEGDGELLARLLGEQLGARTRLHERFRTAVVVLENGFKIDIATARTEFYEFPAALPRVERASIREDMYRRDFTINTLAICLNPNKFGVLIDYFGGREDLINRKIRILYNFSFVEDPTRIIRAIRFAQRYDFIIEPDTLRLAYDAVNRNMLSRLSPERAMHEFVLILQERTPLPALQQLITLGVWEYILPEVDSQKIEWLLFARFNEVRQWLNTCNSEPIYKTWLVYYMIICKNISKASLRGILNRYTYNKYVSNCLEQAQDIPGIVEALQRKEYPLSKIHNSLGAFPLENLLFALVCCKDEYTFNNIKRYLCLRDKIKVYTNGEDLKKLSLKPGPVYKLILDRLFDYKLDGLIDSQDSEIEMVKKWMAEERFN
jgi:tRNA nucleotidyltransferase (CCA-adding enzyme)